MDDVEDLAKSLFLQWKRDHSEQGRKERWAWERLVKKDPLKLAMLMTARAILKERKRVAKQKGWTDL